MKVVGNVVEIPHSRIRPFEDQPRTYFDQGLLHDLARSIRAAGQRTPIVVRRIDGDPRHDWELVDGQRRWHAIGMLRQPTIRAIVEEFADEDDQFLASVVSNFAREGHSPVEIAHAIGRLLHRADVQHLSKTAQMERIGEIFGRSLPWVYQHHNLLRLPQEVHALMHPGIKERNRLTISIASILVTVPPEMSVRLAGEISAKGLSVRAAARLVDQEAARAGVKAGVSRHEPRHQRARLLNSLNLLAQEAEYLLDLKVPDFARMFQGRSRSEQESVLYRIEETLGQLSELRDSVRRFIRMNARAA